MSTLPAMDVAGRVERVRARLVDAGCDALVVTRLPNVRYLTGFTGSAGMVLVTLDGLVLLTDGRYTTQAREQVATAGVDATVEIVASQALQLERLEARCAPGTRVGLEAHGVTWAQQRSFADALDARTLVPTEGIVEGLRQIKEPGEVARIRAACAIADDALQATLPILTDRPTEQQFALALEIGMRERGASGTSFDTIVASGPNGAMPHARPTARPIESGELVVIDFGCIVDGYCSDMTRTVSLGDPGADARRLWDVVRESQEAGRAAVVEGVECAAVDRASRQVIDDAGWGELFSHGTGHGVGLEIHEAPRVAKTASGTLDAGVVVTVEPGVYLPGVGGVRIEDTVVVTATGADALTEFPKSLIVQVWRPAPSPGTTRRAPTRQTPTCQTPTCQTPNPTPNRKLTAPIMNVSTNNLKNGMALDLPEGLVTVVEFQHVKPGKGGAFVRTKLKNFRSGAVLERTFRADEKVPLAVIDKREMQYLYREGSAFVFMDNESYEQLHVEDVDLGDAVNYLKEGNLAVLPVHNDKVVGVELPAAVELTVRETEPGVQGDRVSGARKAATLETGLVVQVPLFIEPDEVVKVDTRTGEYLARA